MADINGTDFGQTISGSSDGDSIFANGGDDKVYGGGGDDAIDGGTGNDILNGDSGNDHISGNVGNDTIYGGSGGDALYGYFDDDTIYGGNDGDLIFGGNGNDLMYGDAGDDTLNGGGADDVMFGGDGNDTFNGAGDYSDPNLDGLVYGPAPMGDDEMHGGAGNDSFWGAGSALHSDGSWIHDSYYGDDDNDWFYELAGELTVGGGNGDDYVLLSSSRGSVDGGSGTDTVAFAAYREAEWLSAANGGQVVPLAYTIDLSKLWSGGVGTISSSQGTLTLTNFEQAGQINLSYAMDTAGGDDVVIIGPDYHGNIGSLALPRQDIASVGISTGVGDDKVIGGSGTDVIDGGTGNDELHGGAGWDGLIGGDGDDILDGGAGPDNLIGGAGNDTYYIDDAPYDGSGDIVSEGENGGIDTVVTSFSILDIYGVSAPPANIEVIKTSDAAGTTAIDITGNDLDNTISGNAGTNTLDGRAGNDVLRGGGGSDMLIGGDGSDTADYGDASGSVVVNLAITGSQDTGAAGSDTLQSIEDLTGGAYADTLTGDDSANELTGGGGADTLVGNGGDDTLQGLSGDDTLRGGAGNDTLIGGPGADRMQGGIGDDTYYAEAADTVLENVGEGVDTVVAAQSYTLSANVENLTLAIRYTADGPEELVRTGWGNTLDNRIAGTSQDDVLHGRAGNDTLIGIGGQDYLDGGAGADTMIGGLQADTYVIDNIGDVIQGEVSGSDFPGDTVISSISFDLYHSWIENITFTGSADLDSFGDDGTNVMIGNSGANQLEGYFGDDVLTGNAGNDTLLGDDGADVLRGGTGSDTLDGGTGADQMYGGRGNDSYIVADANDATFESAGEGTDLVLASVSVTLGANIEQLTLTGSDAIDGTGNVLDNAITGNDAANTLTGYLGNDKLYGLGGDDILRGGDGSDWLEGGAGRDQLYGGTGVDRFVFRDGDFGGATSDTADVIHDFSSAEHDLIRLDFVDADTTAGGTQHFTFVGAADFTGTAGELRYQQVSGNTYVTGDTNGDGSADFMIAIDGAHSLTSADFVLG